MTARTTETTVTFQNCFVLTALDGAQPAGTYQLVVDEEEIQGLSFLAFRRTATAARRFLGGVARASTS